MLIFQMKKKITFELAERSIYRIYTSDGFIYLGCEIFFLQQLVVRAIGNDTWLLRYT